MSIKVQMFIKLPYVIKLAKDKDYHFSFEFDEFEIFNLSMRFNDVNNESIYNEDYPSNYCSNIVIEAIYKHCNYLDYKKEKIPFLKGSENQFKIKLPLKETEKIFNTINKRLEKIFNYLRNKTNMFWIDELPMKPIAYCFGEEIEFNFYSPNTEMSKNLRFTTKYTDYYMISESFKNINEVDDNIFNSFSEDKNDVEIYSLYLHKAEKSLYERKLNDFIIYSSISVESFIRRYINRIKPKMI